MSAAPRPASARATSAAAAVSPVAGAGAGGPLVALSVVGCLDGDAGRRLVDAVESALRDGCRRVEIDLGAVAEFDDEGSSALATCIRRGRVLDEGVTVHVDSGISRQVFLASLSGV